MCEDDKERSREDNHINTAIKLYLENGASVKFTGASLEKQLDIGSKAKYMAIRVSASLTELKAFYFKSALSASIFCS